MTGQMGQKIVGSSSTVLGDCAFGQFYSIGTVLGVYVETPITQIGIFFRLTNVYLFTLNTSVGTGHIYGR